MWLISVLKKVRWVGAKKTRSNDCSDYDCDELLELWGMWSTLSLPLLPGSLLIGVVVSVRVPSIDQIELFNHLLKLK